jgi:hypothetical protein
VLVEVFERVDLNAQSDDVPLQYRDTSITYLALNDFLNIAIELRTAPEVLAYLDARRALPFTDLRIIGDERALFEFSTCSTTAAWLAAAVRLTQQ